ncbi:MAG: radical SAM protein [Elusimicrobia bacterium]|nr:radical SAM protein [Candidatus Liberimonas magnetica]
MRVALIQCPVWGTREPPLSIVQLSACLKSKGHEAKSYDLNNYLYTKREDNMKNLWAWEQSSFWYDKNSVNEFFLSMNNIINSFTENILKHAPRMAAFSITSSTYWASIQYAKELKEKNKDLLIIFGGQIFNEKCYIEKIFKESPVDYVIPGEGDRAFPELCQEMDKSGSLRDCLGVYIRDKEKTFYTGDRKPMNNLDSLPYMDFSDLKIEDYDDKEHFAIMSSRGCVWDCSFCSSRSFWGTYREMNAERLHQEISFHKLSYPEICHIDFQDLVFNANVSRTEEFCDLMIKYPPYGTKILWVANAIINKKMTTNIVQKMAKAGCKHLIFGIESGSARILKLMNKKYDIKDAKRIIKDACESGIRVTGNFMFGFPGETENDFHLTLDFIKDMGKYFTRVYPSRTYCAIEENSKLHTEPGKFMIKTPFSHHLYWETLDGKNTYPVRLKRCKEFEKLCLDLGVQVDNGVRTTVELDEWFNLGSYYEYINEYDTALEYFRKYQKLDPKNEAVLNRIKSIDTKILNKTV